MPNYKKAYKGRYRPLNPHKWTNPKNIIYRSGIELRYFKYFDNHNDVYRIAAEKVVVPYRNPITGRPARYIVDLLVSFRDKNGRDKTVLIEIKSASESLPPKKQKTMTRAYQARLAVWAINQAKWQAADKYCKQRGWVFKVFTDKDFN